MDACLVFWGAKQLPGKSLGGQERSGKGCCTVVNSSSQPETSHGDGQLSLVPSHVPQWAAENPDEGLPYDSVKLRKYGLVARGVHSAQDEHNLWQGKA